MSVLFLLCWCLAWIIPLLFQGIEHELIERNLDKSKNSTLNVNGSLSAADCATLMRSNHSTHRPGAVMR